MRRSVPTTAAALVALVALVAPATGARAATSTRWEISTGERFATGTLDGTAVDAAGRVRLAPALDTLWGPDEGIVWSVAPHGADGALVALSNPSRVLRVGGDEPETWFIARADGALITALAADGEGGAWFGLAPDGQVYHARDRSSARAVVDTGSVFVWALAARAPGSVWIGTGVPGALLRWDGSGEAERVLDTGDDPVRSIVATPDGGAIVGTGGRGRVIRVGADGTRFVMHDADETEIVALARRDDGSVFALAASSGRQLGRATPAPERAVDATIRVTASAPTGERGDNGSGSGDRSEQRATRRSPARVQVAPGAALYRIDADGHVTRIWRSARHAPFSLVALGDGRALIGSGDDGQLIEVDDRGRTGRLFQLPSAQVSALHASPAGRLLAGGTGDARVVALGATPRTSGRYTTPAIDAGRPARWGRVDWDAERPGGTGLTVRARGGNTDEPDETWSGWVGLSADGVPDGLPVTRRLQLRFELRGSRRGATPSVSAVRVHYLPRNRPPRVDTIEVEPPGVVWARPPAPSNATRGPQVADDPVARAVVASLRPNARTATVRKSYEVGVRTVSWTADDPDGDRLTFDLDLRREGRAEWQPLARGVEDVFFSFDARAIDDGRYRVRVRARDEADNPAAAQYEDERIGELFLVDTTPPALGAPDWRRADADGWTLEFDASDVTSEIVAAELSIDGGPWRPLRASDGVADSPREQFRTTLPSGDGARGVRAVRVRVADAAGNLTGAAWDVGARGTR